MGILKHTNPCGVGQDDEDLRNAWQKAFETDTQAPSAGDRGQPPDDGRPGPCAERHFHGCHHRSGV
ncbi:MAG: hypothetical protein ACLSUW_05305 [Akkermansia sp.]